MDYSEIQEVDEMIEYSKTFKQSVFKNQDDLKRKGFQVGKEDNQSNKKKLQNMRSLSPEDNLQDGYGGENYLTNAEQQLDFDAIMKNSRSDENLDDIFNDINNLVLFESKIAIQLEEQQNNKGEKEGNSDEEFDDEDSDLFLTKHRSTNPEGGSDKAFSARNIEKPTKSDDLIQNSTSKKKQQKKKSKQKHPEKDDNKEIFNSISDLESSSSSQSSIEDNKFQPSQSVPQHIINFNIKNQDIIQEVQFLKKSTSNQQSMLNRKSVFTQEIQAQQNGKSSQNHGNASQYQLNGATNQNMYKYKVFYFETSYCINIFMMKSLKIIDLVKSAMQEYLNDPNSDKKKMKYKSDPKAYQLLILEDDQKDGYLPDYDFPPLEFERPLQKMMVDSVCLVDNKNYVPVESKNTFDFNETINLPEIKRLASTNNDKQILFHIVIEEENFQSFIKLNNDAQVKDIFDQIKIKHTKYISKNYIVKIRQGTEFQELHLNMPIINLESNKIFLEQRQFLDAPCQSVGIGGEKIARSFLQELLPQEETTQQQVRKQSNVQAPLNMIQACRYDEWEVMKVTGSGNRLQRFLGIDQFKIYNKKKKDNNEGIFEKIFHQNTKIPERNLEDLIELKFQPPCTITMKFKDDENKSLKYETKTAQAANQIINKLKFLSKMHRERDGGQGNF